MLLRNRTAVLLLTVVSAALHAQEAKKPGALRIGVALPDGPGSVLEPVRGELIKYLSGPTVEVVPLTSRVGVQIDAEAKVKKCDYILYSTVTQKAGSTSAKKGFLRSATSAARMMPMIGAAHGVGGYVAAETATSAVTGVAETTSMVKSQDEWTLAYRLIGHEGAVVMEKTATAKASADREDIISPLLRQAAETVLGKVLGK